jgi:ATP-dependent RNA helicase SUPV3L1/SUV3
MFKSSKPETPAVKTPSTKQAEAHPLDGLTGGAFSAPTSGERTARIRTWLATEPTAEQMAEVYKDLANRDKGAAKPLKEKLDEIKRSKGQEVVAAEWAEKAQALLAVPKLNLADALAWQRDAAKAGAPLSKEPLAGLKAATGRPRQDD